MAVKQIKGEDDYADSDGDADSDNDQKKGQSFIDASSKFGVKTLKSKTSKDARITGKELNSDQVLKAARMVTGNISDSGSEESDVE